MIILQPQTTQPALKTTHVQPAVPEIDPSQTSDLPDILTIIRDDLAFLDRINQILSAKIKAGYKGQRDTAPHI